MLRKITQSPTVHQMSSSHITYDINYGLSLVLVIRLGFVVRQYGADRPIAAVRPMNQLVTPVTIHESLSSLDMKL